MSCASKPPSCLSGSRPREPTVHSRSRTRGGYEIIHSSPGLEVGVYVLVAPEPDHQNAHADDELYVVLEGRGQLTIEGQSTPLAEGQAAFVPAGSEHQFTGYEGLSVLVVFARQKERMPLSSGRNRPGHVRCKSAGRGIG